MFLIHTLAFIGELHVANEEHKAFCSSTSSRHKLIYPTCWKQKHELEFVDFEEMRIH